MGKLRQIPGNFSAVVSSGLGSSMKQDASVALRRKSNRQASTGSQKEIQPLPTRAPSKPGTNRPHFPIYPHQATANVDRFDAQRLTPGSPRHSPFTINGPTPFPLLPQTSDLQPFRPLPRAIRPGPRDLRFSPYALPEKRLTTPCPSPCALRPALCALRPLPSAMRPVPCPLRSAPCAMRHAPCAMRSAPCTMPSALCAMRPALCALRHAPCALPSALCAMRPVPCPLRSAPCALRSAPFALLPPPRTCRDPLIFDPIHGIFQSVRSESGCLRPLCET